MLSVAEPLWLSEPLVPVTLKVELPSVAVAVVLIVSVVEPDLLTEVGLKVPVAPDGNPDTPKLTVPVKPLSGVTVTVYDMGLPTTTACDGGDTATE
jgi:hypothetical protein